MAYQVRLKWFYWCQALQYLVAGLTATVMLESGHALASLSRTSDKSENPKSTAIAQAGIQDDPVPEFEPLPLPEDEPILPPPPSDERPPSEEPEGMPTMEEIPAEAQIEVRDIQVIGSTVFDSAVLEATVAPFENRMLSLADLQQAASTITELYLQAGYITSRAVLPDQAAEEGVVQLLVIEGELSDIRVEGTERLQHYVRDRVAIGSDSPLNQRALEDQLRLLQFDPLFENIEASLSAGETLGESILTVNVTEAAPFRVNLVADNYSPDSIGRERIGAEISYLNPLGFGDEFFTSAYIAPGGGSNVYELGYRVPLNARNGTLQMRFVPSNFRIVNPEEANIPDNLDIRGAADFYSVNFRQPLIRTPREEFALSSGFRYRSGETLISDFLIDSSVVSVIEFGQDYLRRDTQGAWAFQSQFNIGTGLFDATVNDSGLADGRFFSWQGQLQRVQLLGPNQTLVMQADLQFSSDALLGSEQFILGGGQSVRGFGQNVLAGDNGFRFSIEDRLVVLRNNAEEPLLQIVPFLDFGFVWSHDSSQSTSDDDFILGSGVGVIFTPIPQIDVRLDLGLPLVDVDDPIDPDASARVHFQFVYSPWR